jgi:L-lactate dehydrogenase
MKVSIIGTGNVGGALLTYLVDVPSIDKILVMNIEEEWSKAAILDAASAKPETALKLVAAPFNQLSESDLILLTSGVQMKKGETNQDVLQKNIDITNSILDSGPIKRSAIVIAVATPVDDITAHIQKRYKLPKNQILGFGGDLDRNRLIYLLRREGKFIQETDVVGEHGKNSIPVYKGEENYRELANNVRNFLANITTLGVTLKNFAAGLLLAEVVKSITTDSNNLHYVCGYHPDYKIYTTWPFHIGIKGLLEPKPLNLGPYAKEEFELLIEKRKKSES